MRQRERWWLVAVSSGSRQAKTDSESTLEEPNKEFLVWEREVREGRRDQSNETSYQIFNGVDG